MSVNVQGGIGNMYVKQPNDAPPNCPFSFAFQKKPILFYTNIVALYICTYR
jgi:hypothetical protein